MHESIPPARSARRLASILALAAIGLVSACSGESAAPSAPGGQAVASVASVPHGTASSPAKTVAAAGERPLIRIDTDPKEVDRMYETYTTCLTDHGAPARGQRETGAQASGDEAAAVAACAVKEPEDYQEREKRTNPELFQDHQREQIKCMRAHGLAIETGPDGWGYTNPAKDMGSRWDTQCEQLAFGG